MRRSLVTLVVLIATSLATSPVFYVQHEKRSGLPRGWSRQSRMPSSTIIPIRIALSQGNLDRADEYLLDVSHPESPNYGKHWTAKQVAEAFAPKDESRQAVIGWLTGSGISSGRIKVSQSLGWLTFNATIAEAESLLRTNFHLHKHTTGMPQVGCDTYYVPKHIQPHVDFITPTVHFDTKVTNAIAKRGTPTASGSVGTSRIVGTGTSGIFGTGTGTSGVVGTAAAGIPVQSNAALKITKPNNPQQPKKGADVNVAAITSELAMCNTMITPACLRALYNFPPGSYLNSSNTTNSFGIVEYTPNAFLQSDLNMFFNRFSKNQSHLTPIIDLIDGAEVQTSSVGFDFNGESDLDLQYAMTLVNPAQVTLYQTGDLVEGASFNNFLDAIDGSYCTYEGGDDPLQDGTYPDPFFGGYTGPENCGGFGATKVISTSYSYNEADLTPFYETRQCNEYMKLGLQGVTILYSSGDYGVGGGLGECIGESTGSNPPVYTDGTYGMFNPSFPSTCPYVTSVGATQIVPGGTVAQPEEACETVIFSGGGFSNVFGLPSYQAAAVTNWFKTFPPPFGSSRFNNTRKSRGFPDISANGANYVVAVDGVFTLVYGTSASSPVVGSIFTLINEARARIHKGSIGFVNPTLYADPSVLNDITIGNNPGCGTAGFTAVPGWDPVTGLGTPNFPKLCLRRAAFRALSSSPSVSIATKTRTLTSIASSIPRTQFQSRSINAFQLRFFADEAATTRSQPEDGENSFAASESSEPPKTEQQAAEAAASPSTTTETIHRSATQQVADAARSTAESVTSAASSAAQSLGEAAGFGAALQGTGGPTGKTVYVGNLFFDVKAEDLKNEFSKAGEVVSAKLIEDRRGLSKGYGYIEFAREEDATAAIERFNLHTFEGRRLSVQYAISRAERPLGGGNTFKDGRPPAEPSKTLFIGNMSFDMSDRDLNNLFREINGVTDVRVAIDRRTGQPRGFAHADFRDLETAAAALAELRGKVVCGRSLRVDFSVSTGRAAIGGAMGPNEGGSGSEGGRRDGAY